MRIVSSFFCLLVLIGYSSFCLATAHSAQNLTSTKIGKIDLVIVHKSKTSLSLMSKGKEVRRYKIAMGDHPIGHKQQEGDQRTPEGRYILDYKKSDSAYYRAIHISYPNEEDRLRAEALGIDPGGQIMIHGQNPSSSLTPEEIQQRNWTDGCIALKNDEIDELWKFVEIGTPIEIWP